MQSEIASIKLHAGSKRLRKIVAVSLTVGVFSCASAILIDIALASSAAASSFPLPLPKSLIAFPIVCLISRPVCRIVPLSEARSSHAVALRILLSSRSLTSRSVLGVTLGVADIVAEVLGVAVAVVDGPGVEEVEGSGVGEDDFDGVIDGVTEGCG